MKKFKSSKRSVSKPRPLTVCGGVFNKLKITEGVDDILNFALSGESLTEVQVHSVENANSTFIMGISLNRLKVISKMLNRLDSIEDKLHKRSDDEKVTVSQLINIHKSMVERLDKEMEYLKDKEGLEAIVNVYNDNRKVTTVVGDNKEMSVEGRSVPSSVQSESLPREGRLKVSRLLEEILESKPSDDILSGEV